MGTLKIIPGLVSVLTIVFSQLALSQGFLVNPTRKDLLCSSPGKTDFTLLVVNSGLIEHFRVYPLSVRQERDGSLTFTFPDPPFYSCSKWISINPSSFSLPSGQQKEIICTITVPAGQSGDKYAAIVTEQVVEEGREKEFPVRLRIVTLIRAKIPGENLDPQASISGLRAEKIDNFPQRIKLICSVKNEGKIQINAKVEAKIVNRQEKIFSLTHLQAGTGTVLPGTTRDFTGELSIPSSLQDFTAVATLTYGEDKEGNPLTIRTSVPLTLLLADLPLNNK